MQITITIERSEAWVAAERLSQGVNAPKSVDVEVDPAELTEESRAILLSHGDEYADIDGLWHSHQRDLGSHYGFGQERFCADVEAADVTPDVLSVAIICAAARIDAGRAVWQAKEADREEAEAAENRQKNLDEEAKRRARDLLADELGELKKRLDQANSNRNDERDDRKTLSDFLRAVPMDALRGAARKIAEAETSEGEVDVAGRIDDAATCYIFDRDDDEEEDM